MLEDTHRNTRHDTAAQVVAWRGWGGGRIRYGTFGWAESEMGKGGCVGDKAVRTCVRACIRRCVRACVRACVCLCVRACVCDVGVAVCLHVV